MIAVLGFKRIVLLAGLLALNVVLALGVYVYLIPQEQQADRALRGLRGQISTLRSDIDRMQVEFDELGRQKEVFQNLSDDGFFKVQNRRQAEKIFNEIQQESGVSTAVAVVESGIVEDNEEAKKVEYKILKSPVKIELESIDDVSIFHYLFLLEQRFPGHIMVESLHIERDADITGTVLRAIAAKPEPDLVKAELELVWRTMIPQSKVIGGGQP